MSLAASSSRQGAASASNKRKRADDGKMADSFTRSILMKDLVALQKHPLPFAWIPDDVLIDDNILAWQLFLIGPEGTQLCVPRPLLPSLVLAVGERSPLFKPRARWPRGCCARPLAQTGPQLTPLRCASQRGRRVQNPAHFPADVPERAARDALRNAALASK
jgi:hypothetical protein